MSLKSGGAEWEFETYLVKFRDLFSTTRPKKQWVHLHPLHLLVWRLCLYIMYIRQSILKGVHCLYSSVSHKIQNVLVYDIWQILMCFDRIFINKTPWNCEVCSLNSPTSHHNTIFGLWCGCEEEAQEGRRAFGTKVTFSSALIRSRQGS